MGDQSGPLDDQLTEADEIRNAGMGRPHVVILGAGASVAALPQGDQRGKPLPVMADLIEILGLADDLRRLGVDFEARGFEELYGELTAAGNEQAVALIENMVRAYFSGLKLPDTPTIYDHLVLSLRPKDVIATFNWDPFLYRVCERNHHHTALPAVLYLHGNVEVGYCLSDRRKGRVGTPCSKCGNTFLPSRLLFPVQKKNYSADPAITAEWKALRRFLADAYMLTIFGYGAPVSDVEAIDLMKSAWGNPDKRNLEEVEIIDIKPESELHDKWAPFIHSHHYQVAHSFYESWIAAHPRRSCEVMWNQLMDVKWVQPRALPKNAPFGPLWDWYRPLLEAEN